MSKYWFEQAKPNDLLRLHGPLGTFFLRKAAGRDLVFLATGTGIAPVKAMLESMAELPPDQQPRSVNVFWGGRGTQDIYLNVSAPGLPLTYTPSCRARRLHGRALLVMCKTSTSVQSPR